MEISTPSTLLMQYTTFLIFTCLATTVPAQMLIITAVHTPNTTAAAANTTTITTNTQQIHTNELPEEIQRAFSSNSLGKEGFACARRTIEQYTLNIRCTSS